MIEVSNPHDRFFKRAFGYPQVAREFFETHLPKWLQVRIQIETLAIQSGHFVDETLKLQETDVLFSVRWKQQAGHLYLLVEH